MDGNGLILYLVLLTSLVVHEAAHALVALWGGDKTAYLGGQVTLNPIPHIRREPFGTVILPLVLIISSGGQMCMGYAHAPIDATWAYHNPRKAALMAAAGPASNFLLVLLTVLVVKILMLLDLMQLQYPAYHWMQVFEPVGQDSGGVMQIVCLICATFMMLNVLLGLLNLLPLPPLDGAKIVGGLFPKSVGKSLDRLQNPMFALPIAIGMIYLLMGHGGSVYKYALYPTFNLFIALLK